jgi:hypothetical protein
VRRAAVLSAGLAAGLTLATAWRLTALPEGVRADAPLPATSVPLAFHVHTSRSDGTGSVGEVASAAASAGLRVVVLTDHGDGTRVPDPPRYLHGVLVLDGVEISTWGGHYVALGAGASPYPLGGAPDTVVEDVGRLGGFGVAAHPGSSKDDLRWRGWDAGFDGLEWLNADSEWRDRPWDLWTALITYPWNAPATLASLLHRPVFELREWDRRTSQRPIVALAAHDAHARLGLRGAAEPYDGWVALRAPGYASMFRTFTNVVRLSAALSGDAARDAEAVSGALSRGSVYSVITAGSPPPDVQFTATSGGRMASMGELLPPHGPVTFTGLVETTSDVTSVLACEGRVVATTRGGRLTWTSADAPGACRLEVSNLRGDLAPWVITNPIYGRQTPVVAAPLALGSPRVIVPVAGSGEPEGWATETSTGSSAAMAPSDTPGRVRLTWRLGAGREAFAAVRTVTPPALPDFDRLIVRASADRPLRLWIQLRTPADGGQRWGRSVFLDRTSRQVTLPFASFLPLDPGARPAVPLDRITALLLVVDTVNARPGDVGAVTLDELWLGQ